MKHSIDVRGTWAEAGQWMQGLRQSAELTAAEVAEQIAAPSARWVEEIEAGQRPVASSYYASFARVYGVSLSAFAADCLGYYDPKAYDALFSGEAAEYRQAA